MSHDAHEPRSLAAARRVLRGVDLTTDAGRRQASLLLVRAGWFAVQVPAVLARLAAERA